MKTKILTSLLILLGLSGWGQNVQNDDEKELTKNPATYTNNRLGFTFQYPSTWFKNGKDAEVVNLSGTVTAVEINFTDTVSKTTFLIAYHLAPKGAELYQYAVSQYDSSRGDKQIEVAGNKAIESYTTIHIDGRGNTLNPSLRLIVVYFLDKKQTGEIELQFKTPVTNENSEVAKFNQLLSSFKFIN